MGNKPSTKEINRILFDDDLDKPKIYELIGKKGNGILVELAILAHRTKDYTRLDEFIKTECQKFLINSGKGEFVFLLYNLFLKILVILFYLDIIRRHKWLTIQI